MKRAVAFLILFFILILLYKYPFYSFWLLPIKIISPSIMESVVMYIDYFDSPLGLIEFTSTEAGIAHVIFCGEQTQREKPNKITDLCKQQLADYFNGKRKVFDLSK